MDAKLRQFEREVERDSELLRGLQPPAVPPPLRQRVVEAIQATAAQRRRRLQWRQPLLSVAGVAAALLLALVWHPSLNTPTAGLSVEAADAYVAQWLEAAETSEAQLAALVSEPWRAEPRVYPEADNLFEDVLDGLDTALGAES